MDVRYKNPKYIEKPGRGHEDRGRDWKNRNLPDTNPKMPLFGIIWYTYNPSQPTDYSTSALQSSPARIGLNWDRVRTALEARINARGGVVEDEIVVNINQVYFNGEAIFDLASMLDVVAIGHWPPIEHIQEIKARSLIDTKVLLWNDCESIGQAPPWSAKRLPLWTWQKTELAGNEIVDTSSGCGGGTNGYGCTAIDKYETTGQSGGPCGATYDLGQVACPHSANHNGLPGQADLGSVHTWDIDIDNLAFVDGGEVLNDWLYNHYSILEGNYKAGGVYVTDGFIYDNVLPSPYAGTAYNTHSSAYISGYRDAYKEVLNAYTDYAANGDPYTPGYPPGVWESQEHVLWGNASHHTQNYSLSDLKNRYVENFFLEGGTVAKTWEQIEEDLAEIASGGTRSVLGVNSSLQNIYYWATTSGGPVQATHGTWEQIYSKVLQLGIAGMVYAPLVQTLPLGYVFHQNGWRTPK